MENSILIGVALVASAVAGLAMFVFQNVTNSLPYTLLWWVPGVRPYTGGVVWFRAPGNMESFIASFPDKAGWYASPRHGFIKDVIATGGDVICNVGGVFSVNGVEYAEERIDLIPNADRLPWFRGCVTLADNQIAVGAKCVDDSIDSRYFGPISVDKAKVLIPFVTLGVCNAYMAKSVNGANAVRMSDGG